MTIATRSGKGALCALAFLGFGIAAPTPNSPEAAENGVLIGPSGVEVLPSFRNKFPAADFNRPVTEPYWQTEIIGKADDSVKKTLDAMANASFIAFEPEFYQVLGISDYSQEKEVEPIFEFPRALLGLTVLFMMAACMRQSVTASLLPSCTLPRRGFSMQFLPWVWRTSLNGSTPVTEKVYPNPPLTIANGAHYFNGSVYWAQEGNYTTPGGIVRMNPITLQTEVVLNNFMGHRFNSPNDVVITKSGVAYFTDGYYGFANFNDTIKPELANGVYRWDMAAGRVRMVAGAGTGLFINPNGVALDATDDILYVTARGFTSADADGNRNIYKFSRSDEQGMLSPPQLLTYADAGFPDGVKVDANGRIYGGVAGAVDVWSKDGTLLGKIKVMADDTAVNMAWVGKWLYIFGRSRIYRVLLT
ncbi:uncharacterized protein PG998_011721 [Apiospora kogelbergensis]|uniref:uncharacterized protein n=1 Tax=Apiospora kogelbergensis TaxID=1337665 RepID=UPI00312F54D7